MKPKTTTSLLPLALLFGPASWHALHDPIHARLHARHILEFLTLFGYCRETAFPLLRALLLPLGPSLVVLALLRRPLSRR